MKRIVFIFTTFLMIGVNLAAEVQRTNKFPIEESVNQKIDIVKEIEKANGMEKKSELIDLAKKHFGELSEAEIKFFTAVENEELADYKSGNEEENKPENANQWGNDRVLHAKKIKWLCTDLKAAKLVIHQGIKIKGACIEGELNLQFAEMGFPLVFFECAFDETIYLQYAQIRVLHLGGTHTGRIEADNLDVKGSVFLSDGFKAKGGVRLGSATIGGNLECDNGEFINHDGRALFADGINVKGNVFLRNGFKAEGEVRFPSANIGGTLDCIKGEFINPGKDALFADGINIKSTVFLRDDFKAQGAVRLLGATIGGDLDCSSDPKKETKGGEFINPKGRAINAERINVKGSVFLRDGFKAKGGVRFLGAMIGGDFDCSGNLEKETKGGEFINPGGQALSADRLNVRGSVFLNNGFKAEGEVRFLGATIGGNFYCIKSEFINPGGVALMADNFKVEGNVYLRDGFKAEGCVSLVDAMIGRSFIWTDVKSPQKATLDLRSAKIGSLWDEQKSWPDKGRLYLHGLVYDNLDDEAPKEAKSRIEWIRLNGGKEFSPQPYEQLAEVLKRNGHENDAKEVLIAKNKDKVRLTQLTWSELLWYRVFGPMIGYGYSPWRAFWIGIVIVLLGWLIFWAGSRAEVMTPAKEGADASGGFCALVYSLDVFVPLVDLRQASYCMPNPNLTGEVSISNKLKLPVKGKYLRYYLWFEVIMGWILTTLFVVGLTGLVRT